MLTPHLLVNVHQRKRTARYHVILTGGVLLVGITVNQLELDNQRTLLAIC
jgi:hypothetical protein